MNFILKIVGEKKSGAHRKQDGYSGIRYVFHWNDQVRAYTYDPKNQAEVDDLFKNKSMLVQYSPVEKAPKPYVAAIDPGKSEPDKHAERLVRMPGAITDVAEVVKRIKGIPADATWKANDDGTITVAWQQEKKSAPISPAFVEQCLARGVIVTEDDSDETAQRLITAYDKGATDQLARVATAGARPRRNSANTPSAKTV